MVPGAEGESEAGADDVGEDVEGVEVAVVGQERLQDLGADGQEAGYEEEGQVDEAAAGGLEDPVEGDLGGRVSVLDFEIGVVGGCAVGGGPRDGEALRREGCGYEDGGVQARKAYGQEEEGDKMQAFVALAILRDLVRSEAQVGGGQTEGDEGSCRSALVSGVSLAGLRLDMDAPANGLRTRICGMSRCISGRRRVCCRFCRGISVRRCSRVQVNDTGRLRDS